MQSYGLYNSVAINLEELQIQKEKLIHQNMETMVGHQDICKTLMQW